MLKKKRKNKNMAAIPQSAYDVARVMRARYESEPVIVDVLINRGLSEGEARFVVYDSVLVEKREKNRFYAKVRQDRHVRFALYSTVMLVAGVIIMLLATGPYGELLGKAMIIIAVLSIISNGIMWVFEGI
ncbi:MAG: hypothetical protein KC546_09495 [Anaerolineae bacterium]|nr:hypothetical protein [Anaerolineae bacterium]MCA9894995.1 hypothetical protein [Anaerolineae bacterium]MCB9460574.1 hypothetical protein [Anaerolineaceae bacterium]